jgi:hypothetical protein
MNTAVYILNVIVMAVCAVLLLRGYSRGKQRLLLWSGLCFAGLALSNLLVFVDLVVLPVQVDLYPLRLAVAAVSMVVLVWALIWEGQ